MSGLINTPEHVRVWNACIGVLHDWAVDCDGRKIRKSDYGKLSEFGWEIDHVVPTAFGGLDTYANKRPRHWQGNRSAGGLINALLGGGPFASR